MKQLMVGSQFNGWKVLRFVGRRGHGNKYWLCYCTVCKQTKRPVAQHHLKSGRSRNCGCVRSTENAKRIRQMNKNHFGKGNPNYRHGAAVEGLTPEYRAYQAMMTRCNNPNFHQYNNYGGAGVKVCKRWQGPGGFKRFLLDVGEKPTPRHSLGRFLDRGNYAPTNCRWMSQKEQSAERVKNNRLKEKENGNADYSS